MTVEELKQLAQNTTAGPWESDVYGNVFIVIPDERGDPEPLLVAEADYRDAPYIAAVNPRTITSLIERLEDAEGALFNYTNAAYEKHAAKWSINL